MRLCHRKKCNSATCKSGGHRSDVVCVVFSLQGFQFCSLSFCWIEGLLDQFRKGYYRICAFGRGARLIPRGMLQCWNLHRGLSIPRLWPERAKEKTEGAERWFLGKQHLWSEFQTLSNRELEEKASSEGEECACAPRLSKHLQTVWNI